LENHLNTFIGNPDYSKRDYDTKRITLMIKKGERIINDLSNALKDSK